MSNVENPQALDESMESDIEEFHEPELNLFEEDSTTEHLINGIVIVAALNMH